MLLACNCARTPIAHERLPCSPALGFIIGNERPMTRDKRDSRSRYMRLLRRHIDIETFKGCARTALDLWRSGIVSLYHGLRTGSQYEREADPDSVDETMVSIGAPSSYALPYLFDCYSLQSSLRYLCASHCSPEVKADLTRPHHLLQSRLRWSTAAACSCSRDNGTRATTST